MGDGMKKIKGTNLGNWLVLERWMQEDIFRKTDAPDETWLYRKGDLPEIEKEITRHRETYVTEEDFRNIAEHGLNMIRIPVPYFVFGDVPPYVGCVTYLDRAFSWAEKYGLQILVDLHTAPGGQNGYDNGGITGVCKWCRQPESVEFCLTVLERLAERYGKQESLFGIEVLNEPISFLVYLTSPTRNAAVDKEEAKGSGHVPMRFLKKFYLEAYTRLRRILPEEKVICFHDGFRLMGWNSFFRKNKMKNVLLDTHIYIHAMEQIVPIHRMWVYRFYIQAEKWKIKFAQRNIPVVVGEWCVCNLYAESMQQPILMEQEWSERFRKICRQIAQMQLEAWKCAQGYFYWNYELNRDMGKDISPYWKNSWDLRRCWEKNWIPGERM